MAQVPTLDEQTRVTLRFLAFIILNIVLMCGAWYAVKNDTQNAREEILALKAEVKELRKDSIDNLRQNSDVKRDVAVLNEQVGQVKEMMMIVVGRSNQADDGIYLPNKNRTKRQ